MGDGLLFPLEVSIRGDSWIVMEISRSPGPSSDLGKRNPAPSPALEVPIYHSLQAINLSDSKASLLPGSRTQPLGLHTAATNTAWAQGCASPCLLPRVLEIEAAVPKQHAFIG